MDTGSEFAYMMAKLGGDIFKDSSALLKEVVLLLYQNKSEREKYLLASGNFEKLALRSKEFSASTMRFEDLEQFKMLSKNTKLEFIVMPSSVKDSGEINIIYNKEQDEILTDILLNIQKQKMENIIDDRDGSIEEIDEMKDRKEEKGIRASLEKIAAEKDKERANSQGHGNIKQDKGIKQKEMER